nr:hypothetical protein [Cytobacillus firmus]
MTVTKARPKSGKLWYTVEDGHNELQSEKSIVASSNDWKSFRIKISLPSENIPENRTVVLHLYEKDEDGDIMNSYPVILESN